MASKSKMMKFEWFNDSKSATVQKLGFGKQANEWFAEAMVRYSDENGLTPYNPLKTDEHIAHGTGHLQKDSGTPLDGPKIEASRYQGTITYPNSPHARYQYNLKARWRMAGIDHWFDQAWQQYKQQITGYVGGKISAQHRKNSR